MLEILCNITQYFQIGGILSIYRSRNKNPIWRITAVLTPLSCNPRLPKSHFKFQYIFPYDCDITSVQKTESMNKYDDDTSELPSEIMFRWLSSMQNEEDVLILKRFERFAKSMINAVIMQSWTTGILSQTSVYFPLRLYYSRIETDSRLDSGDSQNGGPRFGFSLSPVFILHNSEHRVTSFG